ncbi:hypothetical protein [Clostridium fessum]|uniref:hypothetical protein n=1 Tax=Clostridium fessum TaxID=2126740 RepID=UPI003999D349
MQRMDADILKYELGVNAVRTSLPQSLLTTSDRIDFWHYGDSDGSTSAMRRGRIGGNKCGVIW